MANWAWPHTPADNLARILLCDGEPADGGVEAGFLPPDTLAPVQVVWTTWRPWGFDARLYEWHGETLLDRGRTDALIYRPTGRRLTADEIPPAVAEAADTWADAAELLERIAAYPRSGNRWL